MLIIIDIDLIPPVKKQVVTMSQKKLTSIVTPQLTLCESQKSYNVQKFVQKAQSMVHHGRRSLC